MAIPVPGGRIMEERFDVMQMHALDLEELANRRMTPARDELQRDVREYDGEQHQEQHSRRTHLIPFSCAALFQQRAFVRMRTKKCVPKGHK